MSLEKRSPSMKNAGFATPTITVSSRMHASPVPPVLADEVEDYMLQLLRSLIKKAPPFRKLVRGRDSILSQLALAHEQAESACARQASAEAEARELQAQLASFKVNLSYDHDCLKTYCKNMSWLTADNFVQAYRAGMDTGHKIFRPPGSKADIHIEWRVHTACWAASHALHLAGDFVECGVNTGILSRAICNYVPFNETDKTFFLFDTFRGIPEDQMLPSERESRVRENQELYEECYETAKRNFAPFPRAKLIRGKVPDTLGAVAIERVCYLSVDMNIKAPEIAAIEFFWDKLSTGAVVLLDDYGWSGHFEQHDAMDAFARRMNVEILSLPTGQGLLLKP